MPPPTVLSAVPVAPRMHSIAPFYVMEIQRRAFELDAAGRRVIHCEIGQPDFGAPPSVVAAAADVMARDPLGYTGALGLPALREALARWYRARYGIPLSPEGVAITAGASGAFLIAVGSLIGAGDEVLMPDPCYPCNRHFVRMFEGEPKAIPVGPTQRYQLTLADVQAHWGPRTKAVLLATPSNPTGTTILPDELSAITAWVGARGGITFVDEIYHGLAYGSVPASAVGLAPGVVVVGSFSKYFCMTGWRVGWIIAPPPFITEMERFAQNAFICPPVPSQHAAIAALAPGAIDVFEARRLEFERRRDFLLEALPRLGFGIPVMPDGAFYIYADCSRLAPDAFRFAWALLEHAGVAITPGRDFGSHEADRYVRFAYTRSIEELGEAVDRLARYLGTRARGKAG